jgi:hypothetical protein
LTTFTTFLRLWTGNPLTNHMKKYLPPLLIVLLAYVSFYGNHLLVAPEKLFAEHQLDSEQLVLDGILHGKNAGMGKFVPMGRYARQHFQEAQVSPHILYLEENQEGGFQVYKSQFGLQLYVFNTLSKVISGNLRFLQSVAAGLMCLVLLMFYAAIHREFSRRHALVFCLCLAFSPWVVIFARNLYWVEATWFLPAAVSLMFGKVAFESTAGASKLFVFLFVSFLIKFLCGYEYMTTVVLSALAPLAYYHIKYHFRFNQGLSRVIMFGCSVALAFTVAVGIHARSLNPDMRVGLQQIMLTAEKRLSSSNPDAIAKAACLDENVSTTCEQDITKSLTSNRILVVARYFAIPHFVPWIDRAYDATAGKTALKEALKSLRGDKSLGSVSRAIFQMPGDAIAFVVFYALSVVGFLSFIFFAFLAAVRGPNPFTVLLALSFLAPLSWFFMAKGHSDNHYHLNYVLWYLLFVPTGAMLLWGVKKRHTSDLGGQP